MNQEQTEASIKAVGEMMKSKLHLGRAEAFSQIARVNINLAFFIVFCAGWIYFSDPKFGIGLLATGVVSIAVAFYGYNRSQAERELASKALGE